jgi:hypothetical protein
MALVEHQFARRISHRALAAAITAVLLLYVASATVVAQNSTTLLVLRPTPTANGQSSDPNPTPAVQSDVSEIIIGGNPATITAWTPLLNGPTNLQLVVLLDYHQRIDVSPLSNQIEIQKLFDRLPSNVEIAVGYLAHGKAKIAQPFTTDHTLAGKALRMPTKREESDTGGPYYGLHDLAVHWPNPDPGKVRAVLVLTDGVYYDPPPYVYDFAAQKAVSQSIDMASQSLMRAGIAPFPLYSRSFWVPVPQPPACTKCLDQLAAETGGQAIYTPQTGQLTPLLDRFYEILKNEAVVTVAVKGSGLKRLDIKSGCVDRGGIVGPQSVMIGNQTPRK